MIVAFITNKLISFKVVQEGTISQIKLTLIDLSIAMVVFTSAAPVPD